MWLAERFPDEDPTNLQRVALFYEIDALAPPARGRHHATRSRRASSPRRCCAHWRELDFPLVITTNYDQLFESALRDAGKQPRVAVYTPEPRADDRLRDADAREPGRSSSSTATSRDRESIVVTDEDYIQFVLRMSDKEPYDPIPLTLKYYLTGWTTLFVGYSLLDYNLRLLFKTLRWKIDSANVPDMYSVDYQPDPLIFDVWHNQRRYVKFIAQDVWAFVPELYELVLGKELSP